MNVKIEPARISGSIGAIPSKSYAHRILIACALADKPTEVLINAVSDDVRSAVEALKALGAGIVYEKDRITTSPVKHTVRPVVNCGESGTVARFLLPVAVALYGEGVITGEGSLLRRPMETLCNALEKNGCAFNSKNFPVSFRGGMKPGNYEIRGDESSQYISGLFFALPLLDGDSEITLTTSLESSGYAEMTIHVLSLFGIKIRYEAIRENSLFNIIKFTIKGRQKYKSPGRIAVEGDWSNAAFWLAAGVDVTGLNPGSFQKDSLFLSVKNKFEIDASEIPDLVPILSAMAAVRNVVTRIYNVKRLRLKESDRIQSTADMLASLGCEVKTNDNEIIVFGREKLKGGTVSSHNDHRIVMAAAILSCFCEQPVVITDAQAVNKTYPGFFIDFNRLGGKAIVV